MRCLWPSQRPPLFIQSCMWEDRVLTSWVVCCVLSAPICGPFCLLWSTARGRELCRSKTNKRRLGRLPPFSAYAMIAIPFRLAL